MNLLVFAPLLGLLRIGFTVPVYINPDSVVFKSTHLPTNVMNQEDTNKFPTDPRMPLDVTEHDVTVFLEDEGFLSKDEIVNRMDQTTDDSTTLALKRLQQRYHLFESGTLDDDTRRLIAAPRCGVAELNTIDAKWTKRSLTFKISSFPRSIATAEARQLIKQAFDEWTKHVQLTITEVVRGPADIYVSDEQEIHRNRLGQECRFSSNTTLAHAFYPEVGDIHYNNQRTYTADEFFSTTIHEIGHTLGLEHTTSQTSIMFPMHIRYHTEIPPEDRRALQALYGVRQTTVRPTSASGPPKNGPRLCSLDRIDTILNDAEGQTLVLAGNYYYPLSVRNPKGRRIRSKWPRLPAGIEAAFTYRNNKTFFFKHNRVWVYADDQLEAGYPKPIADEFPGLPNNLSTVFLTRNGSLLAIRKKQYWFYSPRMRPQVSKEFPRLVYDFKDMPTNLDAALRHTDGQSYFFKDRSYYVMNMKNYSVGSASPMEGRWFLC
ncbi:matrix metalloproteinase-19-like [Ochlerotatus camptorhynchus]|uniref:matrix metalloproteinase-19-like n=1 Tax=Ochlerotatus camptorhynchus TaxID=644619 RepID=UPI0031DD1572